MTSVEIKPSEIVVMIMDEYTKNNQLMKPDHLNFEEMMFLV